jgi:hypothetical protein
MQRIDPYTLLQWFLNTPPLPEITLLLCDDDIFKRMAEERVKQHFDSRLTRCQGKQALQEFILQMAAGDLFFAPSYGLIEWPDKYTLSQWEEDKKFLKTLSFPLSTGAYVFGPTSLKHVIKSIEGTDLKQGFVCYSPSDTLGFKCAELLLKRYKNIKLAPHKIQESLNVYSGNLVACDMHFARMSQGGLSFEEAFAGYPITHGFDVVDALVKGDTGLIELRIRQCAQSGEDVGVVLHALIHFFKSLVQTYAALKETTDIKKALALAKIPFPSWERIEKALHHISLSKAQIFFLAAPYLELELRQVKQPFEYLSAALIKIVAFSGEES